MHLPLAIVVVTALLAQGGSPAVLVWKSADVRKKGTELAKKLDAQKVASEVVATAGNRRFMVAHR